LSPQTAELVFMSNRDGNGEIYRWRPGDAEWKNLTDHPAGQNWPEISPDGTRIAFQDSREGKLDIWVMGADGSDPQRLTDHPEHDYLPAWTPDGLRITFTSWRTEPGDEEPAPHLYVMNADGSEPRRLMAESLGTSAGAAWAPDGQSFVIARKVGSEAGDADSELYLASAEGEVLRQLTDDDASNGAPAFSPDGAWIAFYTDRGETSMLEVMRTDGSERRTVVTDGQSWYPRWSPDGRWLVYTAATTDMDLDLFVVPVDGSREPVRIVGSEARDGEGRWWPWR